MKTLGVRPIRHYRRVGDGLEMYGSKVDQITPADVSEVTEMAAKVGLKIPLDKEAVKLAETIKLFRATTHAGLAPELEAHQQALDRVEKNVEELLQDLPRLIEFHDDLRSTTRSAASAEMFNTLLAAIEYLRVRRAAWGGGPPPRRNAALWHDDAIYLSFILGTAAVRAQARLSFTKIEAPGVKFIHEALTRAGIKHGGPGAIAQAMVRYNKDRRQAWELSTTELEKSLAISPPKGV